jgi:phosphatidate cytidylyltransferase
MLRQRIITAVLLMLALIAASTLLSLFAFSLLIAAVVLIAADEWGSFFGSVSIMARRGFTVLVGLLMAAAGWLVGLAPGVNSIDTALVSMLMQAALLFWIAGFFLLLSYPRSQPLWNNPLRIALIGICALLPTWLGIVVLKTIMPDGLLVLALIILVAAVDVGAYFAGMNFGRRKLAPALSPNKTWEGVLGGALVCLILAAVFALVLQRYVTELSSLQWLALLACAAAITFFSIVGDLMESMLKRNCDVKDSGNILPGHGGLLDRVDGLVAATPVFVLIMSQLLAPIP